MFLKLLTCGGLDGVDGDAAEDETSEFDSDITLVNRINAWQKDCVSFEADSVGPEISDSKENDDDSISVDETAESVLPIIEVCESVGSNLEYDAGESQTESSLTNMDICVASSHSTSPMSSEESNSSRLEFAVQSIVADSNSDVEPYIEEIVYVPRGVRSPRMTRLPKQPFMPAFHSIWDIAGSEYNAYEEHFINRNRFATYTCLDTSSDPIYDPASDPATTRFASITKPTYETQKPTAIPIHQPQPIRPIKLPKFTEEELEAFLPPPPSLESVARPIATPVDMWTAGMWYDEDFFHFAIGEYENPRAAPQLPPCYNL